MSPLPAKPALTSGQDKAPPFRQLVPPAKLELGRRRVRIKEDRLGLASEFIHSRERSADALFAGTGAPAIRVLEVEDVRLIADAPAEELERLEVALTGEQEPSPAVVPDRACVLGAIRSLDLGQVVEAEEELNALAGTTGCVADKPRDAGKVGRLVECEEQSWIQDSA